MTKSERKLIASRAPYIGTSFGIVDAFERVVVGSSALAFQTAVVSALNQIALEYEAEEGAKKNRERAKRAMRKPWPA